MDNNNQEPKGKTLKDKIFENIQVNKIGIYPKAWFTFRVIALIAVSSLVLMVSIFICNFILFSLRLNDQVPLLSFGARGLFFFLEFFPWGLLFLDVALIIFLEWLLRKFRFGYRKPVLYMLLALLAVTISAGLFIDRATHFNDELLRRDERHELPPGFGGFYRHARRPVPPGSGMCKCVITAMDGNVLTAENIGGEVTSTLRIILPLNNPGLSLLKVGDIVIVAGDISSGTIRAFGIRKLPTLERTPF